MPRRGARSGRGGAESPRSAGEAGRGAGPRLGYGSSCGTRSGRGRVEPEGCGPRLRTLRRPGAGVVTGPAGRRRVFAPGLGGRRGRDQGITRRIARPPADDPLVLPAESAGGPPPLYPGSLGPGRGGSLSPGLRGGWRCRSPWAAPGSGFAALELPSRNFPAPQPAGEAAAAAAALPSLAAPRAGVWRPNLPLLLRAQSGRPSAAAAVA